MTPTLRKTALVILLGAAFAHAVVNKALPLILLTAGISLRLPSWIGLFVSNFLSLVILVVIVDIARSLPRAQRRTQMALCAISLMVPGLSFAFGYAASRYVIGSGVLAMLVLARLSCRRALPLRVYHALAWYIGTWLLFAVGAMAGAVLPSGWSEGLTVVVELAASFTAVAFFAAWCTPLKVVHGKTALVALLAALDFALLVALAGHLFTSPLLAVSGITLCLPLFVYTLASFFLAATILTLLNDEANAIRGVGVILLALGGFSFASSESVLLSVLAMALIVVSYPVRQHTLWHDWRAVLSEKYPSKDSPETAIAADSGA